MRKHGFVAGQLERTNQPSRRIETSRLPEATRTTAGVAHHGKDAPDRGTTDSFVQEIRERANKITEVMEQLLRRSNTDRPWGLHE